jgi:hypothetical protein
MRANTAPSLSPNARSVRDTLPARNHGATFPPSKSSRGAVITAIGGVGSIVGDGEFVAPEPEQQNERLGRIRVVFDDGGRGAKWVDVKRAYSDSYRGRDGMCVSYSAGQSGGLLFWARLAKSNLDSIMPSLFKMGYLGKIGKTPSSLLQT